ncbi:DEAD-box ATP-dependent RNA helicase 5-like, partial [Trifolium medium]|nr:DEAD-box ATP-dependent RNA helicase 5-like [Trifolium medium]
NLQTEENTPKRKHEELNHQNDTESEKKSKKKKHNKSDENDTGKGVETVSASDEPITVTGKNAGDEKYAAVKTFVGSGLPDNVLECCKGFEKPSPIQSRAWPFLLDGRDLIGIAATGSG